MANLDYISHQTLVNASGVPYASAKVYYYETGTTTPKTTYSDAGLSSANANPVVADSNGVVPKVYLIAGRYKRTVTDSSGTSLSQFDVDPLDASLEMITATAAPSPTYPFMRYYNTTDGHAYRRNSGNSAWIDEGPIDGVGSAASVTDVLTGTSTAVLVTPDALAALWQRGTDIASASTLSLPGTGGGVFNVTGTTTINGISTAQGGRQVWLRFAGVVTLTHNGTSFILPGAASITTVAGDMALFINEAAADASGTNYRCFSYIRNSGSPLNITDLIANQATQEASSSSVIVTPATQKYNISAAKGIIRWDGSSGTPTIASAHSFNHSSFTDNGAGDQTITVVTAFSTADYAFVGGAGNNDVSTYVCTQRTTAPTTTTLRIVTDKTGVGATDTRHACIALFGDYS